jgi:hypothetical protein
VTASCPIFDEVNFKVEEPTSLPPHLVLRIGTKLFDEFHFSSLRCK